MPTYRQLWLVNYLGKTWLVKKDKKIAVLGAMILMKEYDDHNMSWCVSATLSSIDSEMGQTKKERLLEHHHDINIPKPINKGNWMEQLSSLFMLESFFVMSRLFDVIS